MWLGERQRSYRKTYEYYSGVANQAEDQLWEDGYQSRYAFRFETALDIVGRYRHHLVGETEEEIADLRKRNTIWKMLLLTSCERRPKMSIDMFLEDSQITKLPNDYIEMVDSKSW